jgi:hypothetical protein
MFILQGKGEDEGDLRSLLGVVGHCHYEVYFLSFPRPCGLFYP